MDIAGPIAAFMIFAVLGACIIVPVWLRHRLYYKQIDTVARAIEKGVDPAEIRRALALPQQSGDVNGNWKAGTILIWLGLAAFVLGLPAALAGPAGNNAGWPMVLLAVVLGIILLRIHKAVVGGVVRLDQLPPAVVGGQAARQAAKGSAAIAAEDQPPQA